MSEKMPYYAVGVLIGLAAGYFIWEKKILDKSTATIEKK